MVPIYLARLRYCRDNFRLLRAEELCEEVLAAEDNGYRLSIEEEDLWEELHWRCITTLKL